jgi:WD40 repeat protein
MVVSPDRQIIAGGYAGGGLGLWEISSGKTYLLMGHTRFVGAVTFSPDSRTLISGGHEGVMS